MADADAASVAQARVQESIEAVTRERLGGVLAWTR
jgi:hypothetical protein